MTNKWLKAGYAEPLRKHLAEHAWVESLVDFGHAKQIFPDADVFPCILVAQKPAEDVKPPAPRVAVIPRETLRIEDLSRQIADEGYTIDRERFGGDAWQLEPPEVTKLLAKIARDRQTLTSLVGSPPLVGIKTGCNDAFLIDTATRDRLVKDDPRCQPLIRQYVRGEDIERWHANWDDVWMIAIKSSVNKAWPWADAGDDAEAVFAKTYPSLHKHMKDEAMFPAGYLMENLPIASPTPAQRAEAEPAVRRLIEITRSRQSMVKRTLDWLKIEFDVVKPTLKLQAPVELGADAFVTEVKKARGQSKVLSAAALAALKEEHARTIAPARAMAVDALALERRLSDLVNAAYGLTPAEIALMWQTAPPRTPLARG